ncbi:uncharacterized protein PAF06_000345 [Gastrophryne carolinensis]
MDATSIGTNSLDEFYKELRRKYPNTFTFAPDLGKGDGTLRKLPHLENAPPTPPRIPQSSLTGAPQRWTPDGFLSKVKLQKFQNVQRQEAEAPLRISAAVVIQDKTIPVPSWNRKDYLATQNRASFRLPSLRTQVEQNKTEIKNKLCNSRTISEEPKIQQSPTLPLGKGRIIAEARSSNESLSTREYLSVPTSVSAPKSDPLGTIMKELLPSKPGRLMSDLPKTPDNFCRNGGCVSDSDSAVSVCAPLKIFRPKIRSPHEAPASSDIIKKFSSKPKAHSGPLKADHTVLPENTTRKVEETGEEMFLRKSSIHYNERIQQRPLTARVRFEDESEEETQARYQERLLLERTHTTKKASDVWARPVMKPFDSTESSPSSQTASETSSTSGQQAINLPYRRQPFPPTVAKKVLIDKPRGGLPSRRPLQIRTSPAVRERQWSSTIGKEATSLDGITMSFTSSSLELKEENLGSSETQKEENKTHDSFSSLQSIGSGITEVSSEVTVTTLEWRGSGSSIACEQQPRPLSRSPNISLNSPSLGKGTDISFYSKVKRRLHVKMKLSSDSGGHQSDLSDYSDSGSQHSKNQEMNLTLDTSQTFDSREKIVSYGKSKPHGANSPIQVITGEIVSSGISKDGMKMDATLCAEAQNTDRDVSVKAQFLPMKMMQSLLKKGRAKNYMVRVPSPPTPDSRPRSGLPAVSAKRLLNKEQILEQESMKLQASKSDISRLVELQRPNTGFKGLNLAKRIQDPHSGLYVVQLSGAFTSSCPQGILNVGDEILEINGRQTKDLGMKEIHSLLAESSCVLLRVVSAANALTFGLFTSPRVFMKVLAPSLPEAMQDVRTMLSTLRVDYQLPQVPCGHLQDGNLFQNDVEYPPSPGPPPGAEVHSSAGGGAVSVGGRPFHRQGMCLLGIMISTIEVVPYAQFHARLLQPLFLSQWNRTVQTLNRRFTLTDSAQ